MKYWIGVVSAGHVARGVQQGIMQIGHGKKVGVNRQKKGDWIIYYSPKQNMDDKEPYQFTVSEEFQPWRRNVAYEPVMPLPIRPILDELSFIKDKAHWGVAFRYGILEIPETDFDFLAGLMRTK